MKNVDFYGIVALEPQLVEQLRAYLQEKESQVGRSIIQAIHPLSRETLSPDLSVSTSEDVRLAKAVDTFSKKVHKITIADRPIVSADDWKLATRQINNALWEYVEVLEGCATELFKQLGQEDFERWQPELMEVVEGVKDLLIHRIEELRWKVRRMESLLWDYRWACEARGGKDLFWKKATTFWKCLLDRSLFSYIEKSKKYLKTHYKAFSRRYNEYAKLKIKVERALKKFDSYQSYQSLENGHKQGFKAIYRLVKLWELNLKVKSLPSRDPVRALRSAYSVDRASEIFKEYFHALQNALFDRSRKFKQESKAIFGDALSVQAIIDAVRSSQAELHTLGVTVTKYRDFFLRTHPNPYIRKRWGFSEWIVAPEPSQTKELLNQVYEIELLDKLYNDILEALKKGELGQNKTEIEQLYREIQQTLHEMGQPLTGRSVMRTRAEKLLFQVQELNELGSFYPEVVDYTGKIFAKALRTDWQYQVFFEFPLFHQLYAVHQGILGKTEDRNHLNRLLKFKELITQIEGWVHDRDAFRHIHEIETDVTDMKGLLQDFLASVQQLGRIEKEKTLIEKERKAYAKQLLEYRYLFSKFFFFLHQHEPEGRQIRNQFLFIDQYFESIETHLHDLRHLYG